MTTYHLNKKGYYAPCQAAKRSCPLGGSEHISETEFQTLKENGSPEILHNFGASETSYYTAAKNKYEQLAQRERLNTKIDQELNRFVNKKYVEEGLIGEDGKILSGAGWDKKYAKEEAIERLRKLYVEAGVNPAKARFISEDIAKQANGIKPVIRKKDKLDTEIEEKTTAAVKLAATDPEFNEALQKYEKADSMNAAYLRVLDAKTAYRKELSHKYQQQLGFFPEPVHESQIASAKKGLEEANAWKKAGIADSASKVLTASVRPNDLSVDAQGRINNAWVRLPSGKVEKIVGYKADDKQTYGTSGNLYTTSGALVAAHTHYHSYRSHESGIGSIIITPKQGKAFEAENFNIHSVLDSGD